MGGVMAYSLTQATVRALYSDLLSPTTWEALIRAQGYDATLGVLGDTIYGPHLEIDRPLLTPRRTVYQIRRHLAEVYEKLVRIAPDAARPVIGELWHHYEVDNIKVTLRGVEAGASWDQVLHLLYPMDKYVSVSVEMLERMVYTGTIHRAVEVLQGTPYYAILDHAMTRYEEENSLFPLEVALDLGYRRDLWASIFRLSRRDREMALKTVGTVLDNDNLLWAIRYRVYHHLSEVEIINYTLAIGYQVKEADIHAIAHGASIADIVFRIHPELQDDLRGVSFESGEGLARLEQALLRLLIARCRRMFLGSPFHIGLPLAYVLLSEYEIRDVTVIVEAKASDVSSEVFAPMLLMPTSTSS